MSPRICIALLSLLIVPTIILGETGALKNEDVVKLVNAGLSTEVILTMISNSPCAFQTDVSAILDLKKEGVPEEIIQAMVEKSGSASRLDTESDRRAGPAVSPDQESGLPTEVGVYYLDNDGSLVEIQPEIVSWKEGGVLKKIATAGITRGHINGIVRGAVSRYKLDGDEALYIYTLEGTSATEYQLLRLWEKKNRRTFRAVTGGVFHASGGADKNAVYFEPTKIASRTYKFQLPQLAPGEYGLLAPFGMTGETSLGSGKIYTFSVNR